MSQAKKKSCIITQSRESWQTCESYLWVAILIECVELYLLIRVRGTSNRSGALIFNESGTASCEQADSSRQSMAVKTAHATSLSELLLRSFHSFFVAVWDRKKDGQC